MTKRLPYNIFRQYLAPQHAFSRIIGWFSDSRLPWLKNWMIKRFIRVVGVDMSEALIENPEDYPTFNTFFTRLLKPELRPIVKAPDQIACPADGFVSQVGQIKDDLLFQAKGFYFNLKNLLGGSDHHIRSFAGGSFATLYLSPKDYHRVHMPLAGTLRETIYIPGNLFSVNTETAQHVPNLFARNERLVCIFDTSAGPMAVILVGAMLVGSISTVWNHQVKTAKLTATSYTTHSIHLERGAELGLFKMGSTVLVLFGKDKTTWSSTLHEDSIVRMGQELGKIL